jgi:hypothetical protein
LGTSLLRLQPELDQAADGLCECHLVILGPFFDGLPLAFIPAQEIFGRLCGDLLSPVSEEFMAQTSNIALRIIYSETDLPSVRWAQIRM